MLRPLFLALNVLPREEKTVLFLLGQGFFMGIFLVTFQISAETLFLNRLGAYLKEAIMVSGFLGIVTTALFSYLQNRIPFSKLALGNLFLIFIFTLLIYLAFEFAGLTFQQYIIFSMFSLTGPIVSVSLLGFWGIFGRLFDLRQSKRIIGGIDSGQLLAAIITSFSIPLLQPFIPETRYYLLISGVSIIFSGIFLFLLTRNFDLSEAEASTITEEQESTKITALMKKKYVRLLLIFLLVSMSTFTVIQFSFQEVVKIQYPGEDEMRNFLAVFNGSILILSFLLQTFVNEKIISNYGLKASLSILPVILIVFTVAAVVSGLLFGYGPEKDTAFIWFFLFIALSRLFNFSLRDSLENPTFKIFFMPLDNRIRFDVQTKVEGLGNETARFMAGAFMLALSYLRFVELIHYSVVLIFLIVAYFVVVDRLSTGYRNNVKLKLLKQQRSTSASFTTAADKLIKKLQHLLGDKNGNKAIFSFRLIEKLRPLMVPEAINILMKQKQGNAKNFALLKMNEQKGFSVSERYVIALEDNFDPGEMQLVKGDDLMSLLRHSAVSHDRISRLSKSLTTQDRQYAAELLSSTDYSDIASLLIELLNDTKPEVRYAAIKAAQSNYNHEVLMTLIDNLGDPLFSAQAANTLEVIGESALDMLDFAFYRSGQSTAVKLKIVQVTGRIGGEKAREILWNKTDFPDKVVVSRVLSALGDCHFKAGITQISGIKFAIESDIENIAWNLAAIGEVEENKLGLEVKQALIEEVENAKEHIYMLLSMLYDTQSIQLVKENIESQTNEGVAFAIELLDIFLSEDLKQRIIPVIDDMSYAEKIRKLEIFYPGNKVMGNRVLKHLLNRDFFQTNPWTKSCIIRQIGLLEIHTFCPDLIAHLFNPDLLIREMAAWALYQIDPHIYHKNVKRLDVNIKNHLDATIGYAKEASGKIARFDKIMFLKNSKAFKPVFGITLANLASITEEVTIAEGEDLPVTDDSKSYFYMVYRGAVQLYHNDKMADRFNFGELISEMGHPQDNPKTVKLTALENTVLLKMKSDRFYNVLADNVNLAREVTEYMQNIHKETYKAHEKNKTADSNVS